MDILNATQALKDQIINVGTSDIPFIPENAVSKRTGPENMDGNLILGTFDKRFMRSWNDCIPFDELLNENLPPFFIRLRDDQIGLLTHWVQTKRDTIQKPKLNLLWPHDLSTAGKPLNFSVNWGPAHDGEGLEKSKLAGDRKVPTWKELPLHATFTSSGKFKVEELHKNTTVAKKRGAEQEAGELREIPVPRKKAKFTAGGPIKTETGARTRSVSRASTAIKPR